MWILLCFFLFIGNVLPLSAHEWLDDYLADDGLRCCNIRDCSRTEVVLISHTPPDMYTFLVNKKEITVRTKAAYPSEDGGGWWCHNGYMAGGDIFTAMGDLPTTNCMNGEISRQCYRCIFYKIGM